jgi:hypothetical protein
MTVFIIFFPQNCRFLLSVSVENFFPFSLQEKLQDARHVEHFTKTESRNLQFWGKKIIKTVIWQPVGWLA